MDDRNSLSRACECEQRDDLKGTLAAYLEAIEEGKAFTDDERIKASLAFFYAQNYGAVVRYGITDDLQFRAWETYSDCLKGVSKNDPACHAEAEFWLAYGPFIIMGDDINKEDGERLCHLTAITPVALLYRVNDRFSTAEQGAARRLLDEVTPPKCYRDRYLKEVLEGLQISGEF